ncbi:hypothetical protein AYO36_11645 [Exiguobacterium sp. KKBO11]|uniref:hypothetical protein n=1 Tax=Exiguobacterium sp. KKBO11 TaxID=1805000 RepID=UPI0007D78073|nr:hypothetical protein [Exiguobacterium sp. KKBO11]OAI85184.1 hypothetical protein AYO36_11645 [Exiguobacterium sp. KKBO11]
MQTVERIYFRESGMGRGQTFWWDRASRRVRAEDEERRLSGWWFQELNLPEELNPLLIELTEEDIYLIDMWSDRFDAEVWRNYPYPEGVMICDGTDWEIHVTTENGTEKLSGSNIYPPGWWMIRELLYGYYDAGSNRKDEEGEGEQ